LAAAPHFLPAAAAARGWVGGGGGGGREASGGRARTTDGEHQQPGRHLSPQINSHLHNFCSVCLWALRRTRILCRRLHHRRESNLLLNVIADLGSGRVRQARARSTPQKTMLRRDIRRDLRFPVLPIAMAELNSESES